MTQHGATLQNSGQFAWHWMSDRNAVGPNVSIYRSYLG